MKFIEEQLSSYFGLNPRSTLISLLEAENDDRKSMEKITDFLVIPDGTNDSKVNIYESNMWNNATLANILRNAGVRTRTAGHPLTSLGLILRLRQVIENNAPETAYEPTAFGRNKYEYWQPIIRELIVGIGITFVTIFAVQYMYSWSEELHHRYNCVKTSEFYSLKCYVFKKCRAYLEDMNYNLVYTVVCGIGIACANTLRKYQTAATSKFAHQ